MINKKYGLSQRQIGKYGFKLCLKVYEKYNRKCSICDNVDYLAIHHIDGSGKTNKPNNSLDNLQLICKRCHASLHAKKYWRKQLRKQGGYLCQGREKKYYSTEKWKKYRRKYRKKYAEKIKKYQKEYRQNKIERN